MQRDLALRARSGDHDAFTALAAEALEGLHRTARLILRRDDRAADAVRSRSFESGVHGSATRLVDELGVDRRGMR
jgi:hypothetical protein